MPSSPLGSNLRKTEVIKVPDGFHIENQQTVCLSLSAALPPYLPGINCHNFSSSALFQFNPSPTGQHLCPLHSSCVQRWRHLVPGEEEQGGSCHLCSHPTCVTVGVSVEPWRSAQAQISDINLHPMGITSTSAAAS